MPDDDLDLDLEIEAEAARPKRGGLFGWFKRGKAAAETASGPEAAASEDADKRPGLTSRFGSQGEPVAGKGSVWNLRNFLIGLVALILLVLVAENWAPARLNLIGLHADIPKSVLLVVDFALGFGVAWWIFRRRGTNPTSK